MAQNDGRSGRYFNVLFGTAPPQKPARNPDGTWCVGIGRGLQGNEEKIGQEGAIRGVVVRQGTAALAPEQFGFSNGGQMKPYASRIYGKIGNALFSSMTDVIGGDEKRSPVPGMRARPGLLKTFPNMLLVEIPGAGDQGKLGAPVRIHVPPELNCPTNTKPESGR